MLNKKNIKPVSSAYLAFVLFGALISIVNSNFFILSTHFSVSLAEVSYMISAMALGRLSTIFISGIAADKIGRKKVMFLSLLCVGIFYLFLPFTENLRTAVFLSVLAGMGHGMADAAATALIFDCFPGNSDFPVSLIQLFFCLGAFSTPIVTSLIYSRNIYFGGLFWGLGLLGLITMTIVLLSKFPSYDITEEEITVKQQFRRKPSLLKDGFLIAVLVFLYSVSTMILTTWAGTYALEVIQLSETGAIQILTFYNIGCMAGTFIIGKMLKRIHPTVFIIIDVAGIAVSMGAFVLLNSPAATYPAFMAAGFFAGINYSLVLSVVGEMFPEKKGTASGATMGMSALGAVVSPLFTGALYGNYGVRPAFYSLFISVFVLFFISIAFRLRYNYLKS